MQAKEMEIRVFRVLGGEGASLLAYEQLVELLETHEDLFLSMYRVFNRADGTWSLILIGEEIVLLQYQKSIEQILSDVHAQPIVVPPESLAPFVERFLARQAAMLRNKETFVEKHHPLSRKHYAKQEEYRPQRKKKCR